VITNPVRFSRGTEKCHKDATKADFVKIQRSHTTTPFDIKLKGGRTISQINNFALKYHFIAQTHIETVVLLQKKTPQYNVSS